MLQEQGFRDELESRGILSEQRFRAILQRISIFDPSDRVSSFQRNRSVMEVVEYQLNEKEFRAYSKFVGI